MTGAMGRDRGNRGQQIDVTSVLLKHMKINNLFSVGFEPNEFDQWLRSVILIRMHKVSASELDFRVDSWQNCDLNHDLNFQPQASSFELELRASSFELRASSFELELRASASSCELELRA